MRTLARWLHGLPRPVRWPLGVLIAWAALWPVVVMAALGVGSAVTLLIMVPLGPLLTRFAARFQHPRTDWTRGEAAERVRLARRGELPADERERSWLRFLLDRELDQTRSVAWFVPVAATVLAVLTLVVLLWKDHPVLAVVGAAWFVVLGVVFTPSAIRAARKDKEEVREALRLLGS